MNATELKTAFDEFKETEQKIEAMQERDNLLKATRNQQLGSLSSAYNAQRATAENALNNNLQSAFIDKQMTLKNLPQVMAARGYNGGMAETTEANILNEYQNGRNALMRDNAATLADIDRGYFSDYGDAAIGYAEKGLDYGLDLAALKEDEKIRRNALITTLKTQGYSDAEINTFLNYGTLPERTAANVVGGTTPQVLLPDGALGIRTQTER